MECTVIAVIGSVLVALCQLPDAPEAGSPKATPPQTEEKTQKAPPPSQPQLKEKRDVREQPRDLREV